MKKITLALFAIVLSVALQAQNYEPSDANSKVKFAIKNFSVNTTGVFKGLTGAIVFDPANPGKSSFEVSVDASTVNSGIDSRDNHLRGEQYFNVKDHPRISIKSTQITPKGTGFTLTGTLTMKGTAKQVSIPFTATAKDNGYLFEGEFQLDRKDFKVGGNSLVLGDNVTVTLSVFATKK